MEEPIVLPTETLKESAADLVRILTAWQNGEAMGWGVLVVRNKEGSLVTAYATDAVEQGHFKYLTLDEWRKLDDL